MKITASDVYLETVRRKDKRNNVYLIPLVSFDENGYFPIHGNDLVITGVSIFDKPFVVWDFSGPFIFSLKPGKYRIKVSFKVHRSLSQEMGYKVSKRANQKLAMGSYDKYLNYSGTKEAEITIGEQGDCYILFKAHLSTTWRSRSGYNEVIWYLDDYKHGYELGQTNLRGVESLCTFWQRGKKEYNYPSMTQEQMMDIILSQWD